MMLRPLNSEYASSTRTIAPARLRRFLDRAVGNRLAGRIVGIGQVHEPCARGERAHDPVERKLEVRTGRDLRDLEADAGDVDLVHLEGGIDDDRDAALARRGRRAHARHFRRHAQPVVQPVGQLDPSRLHAEVALGRRRGRRRIRIRRRLERVDRANRGEHGGGTAGGVLVEVQAKRGVRVGEDEGHKRVLWVRRVPRVQRISHTVAAPV